MDATPPPLHNISDIASEEGHSAEEHAAQGEEANLLTMPEDGYEWRKYGQKYISGACKNRSYFKCRDRRCNAKKTVEWPPLDPANLRVLYIGNHNHPSRLSRMQEDSSASTTNQYDLVNQILGYPNREPQV